MKKEKKLQGLAKNPGPVKRFCLNAGGSPGCWRLKEEHFFGAKVICLQEVRMAPAEFDNFARLNQNYKCYYQPGPMTSGRWGDDRFQGGVAILVHKSVSHKYSHAVNEDGVQIIGIWFQGFHLLNIYSPPGRPQIATKVLGEVFQSLHLHNKAWLVLGDFNELPSEGATGSLLRAFGGKLIETSLEGSRWNSNRLVDWAISNSAKHFQFQGFQKKVHLSDHKGFFLESQQIAVETCKGRLKTQPEISSPRDSGVGGLE